MHDATLALSSVTPVLVPMFAYLANCLPLRAVTFGLTPDRGDVTITVTQDQLLQLVLKTYSRWG